MFNTTNIEGSNSHNAVYLMTKLKNKLAKKVTMDAKYCSV